MKYSLLFRKTRRDIPRDADSINADLLVRAGYIDKLQAGVYTYLHLGKRVLDRVTDVVREEMNAIDGVEILMPSLHPRSVWEATGRYATMDNLFTLKGANDSDHVLGPTHEEIITPLAKNFIQSYKDLPLYPYQIQTKFRNEARAKSGIMRGREFVMKDLYSFHTTQDDLNRFYDIAIEAYHRVYHRLGIGPQTYRVTASGGAFSKNYSDEYQTLSDAGEDVIAYCEHCRWAQNTEVENCPADGDACPHCGHTVAHAKSIEVGNIFKLGTKFSDACHLTYTDADGKEQPVFMGCYGIGISRLMGTILEVHHDDKGIAWPMPVAPYHVVLISLQAENVADEAYAMLQKAGVTVIYDDRAKANAGEKFMDADLCGFPIQVVCSHKLGTDCEIRFRGEEGFVKTSLTDMIPRVQSMIEQKMAQYQ